MQRNHRRRFQLWLLVILGLAVSTARAASLQATLPPVLDAHRGKVAVAVKHLETGEEFLYRAGEPMPTASLIKLPVMIEAYRQACAGSVDLDGMITLREEDKVPGSGLLTVHVSAGAQISLRDAIRLMIAYSDNTATNLVLDRIGIGATAKTMEQLGFPTTKIHAKVFRRDTSVFPERSKEFGLGSTTAGEMIALLEQLHAGKLADESATKEMTEHLLNCQDRAKSPRLLPPGTKVAHKTGSVSQVRCDAGIIYSPNGPIAFCVLTAENADRRWSDENAGNRLCGRVAKVVYDHFNPPGMDAGAPQAILEIGAGGRLVEDLQRTLNAKLSPSPELSVDGDFGGQTRAAVVRFQTESNLEASGVVGASTWKALGTLITADPPVPAPEVVNQEVLPAAAPDALDGPPHVTCKAWAVADGETGELLWGSKQDEPRDFASTTKIMTAFVVLKFAQQDPGILQETVTFSARADETPGSSARIRAGEKLSVGELLYGLLLPSGNDASVALAEHLGSRFAAPPDKPEARDPLARFVAQMNRTAAALGMGQTVYRNPHGLTAEGHCSSARDLLTLAHAALKLPRFARYVNTRQHGCALAGPGGYTRNAVWGNTNRLLPIEGYNGVKTGTTTAAGACLVSSGQRDGKHLLIVVLGSTSGDARYVDTRNLFRWSWKQLQQDAAQ